ncbi:hypothetical protein AGMMS49950_04770 [Endomicrobiia bacterium]|nr:hypothetical protein AGMMS49950_04770 [Endomicrobiia bacterium]
MKNSKIIDLIGEKNANKRRPDFIAKKDKENKNEKNIHCINNITFSDGSCG